MSLFSKYSSIHVIPNHCNSFIHLYTNGISKQSSKTQTILLQSVLSQQYDKHPIIILKDVKYAELRAMMDYMYRGEVNISQDQLAALLKAAESLQIKGLSDNKPSRPPSRPPQPAAHPPRAASPPPQVLNIFFISCQSTNDLMISVVVHLGTNNSSTHTL